MSDGVLQRVTEPSPLAGPAITSDLMRGIVDAAPDGLFIVDGAGLIQLVNSRAEMIFGYNRGELLGREIDVLLPARHRSVHRANRMRYGAEPQIRAMGSGLILHGLRADGTEFPVEISLSPLSSADGLRVIATVRDVTDRTAAEAHARLIRHTLDAVSTDAVLIFDADEMMFTYVNHGASELLGYREAELLAGMTPSHVTVDPDDVQWRAIVKSLVRGDVSSQRFVGVVRRADGHDVSVEWVAECPLAEDGTRRLVVAVVRDMSEQMAAERRVRQIDEAFQIAFDQAPTGIVLADIAEPANRRIIRVKTVFAEMLGYAPDQLVGTSFADLSHPDDAELDAAAAESLASGRSDVYIREKRYRHADGHYMWVELRANLLHGTSDKTPRTLAHVIDISDRKAAEQTREKHAREQAQARADRERVAVLEDRSRIAEALHDSVIRDLFAVGLSLQATADRTEDQPIARRVLDAMAEIDRTIAQIRATVFELGDREDSHLS
jgi:PAS domain S-box-containing protein